jgi:hypothetical protein
VIEHDASPVAVATECVARGADWLKRRWQEGGPKLRQLAIATRVDGLTIPSSSSGGAAGPTRPAATDGRRRGGWGGTGVRSR